MTDVLTTEENTLLRWHLEHPLSYFLKDFFHAGNLDFKMEIYPRDVQSGLWFVATWQDKAERPWHVEAQWLKLLWERLMTAHLIQQRALLSPERTPHE